MRAEFFLFRQGSRWVFDLTPLTNGNANNNLIRALSKVAKRLEQLNVPGDLKLFDGNEFDQASGFWLQQMASGLERAAQSGKMNLLSQQARVKTIRFHEVYPSQESAFQSSQQEIAAVLNQPSAQRPSSNPNLMAQQPPTNPLPIVQKPNSKPAAQQGAQMSNQNIPLVTEDSGQRQIFYYYVFNTNTEAIVKEGSVIVRGKDEAEGKTNLQTRLTPEFLGTPLTSDLQLHVRWVTSFTKKRELDANAKLAEAIRAVMGAK